MAGALTERPAAPAMSLHQTGAHWCRDSIEGLKASDGAETLERVSGGAQRVREWNGWFIVVLAPSRGA